MLLGETAYYFHSQLYLQGGTVRRAFLVQLRNADGSTSLFPMKEWFRQNPDMLPPGVALAEATSHTLRDALKREGWRVVELKTEVHLIPPKTILADESDFHGNRAQSRQRRKQRDDAIPVQPHRTCFVIQPFDNGRFDKRYEDTVRPAILRAGLEPYRVDQDPFSAVPIDDIEAGIRRADTVFAEITLNNPNVWFELGYAIASNKPVVMICDQERVSFPFDVQHRTIIRYQAESPRDFQELGDQLTRRLKAALEAQVQVESLEERSPTVSTEGLTPHELVALISVAAFGIDGELVGPYALKAEMERAGFTDVACALAIRGLEKKLYIRRENRYRGHDEISGFAATETGLDWLERNNDKLKLKQVSRPDE